MTFASVYPMYLAKVEKKGRTKEELQQDNITTMEKNSTIDYSQTFYHGTKANLKTGDLIEVGLNSNYGKKKKAKYIYLTAACRSMFHEYLSAGEMIEFGTDVQKCDDCQSSPH